ncbi:MAG: aspartate kinase [Thermoplasmata archaeon]|nr:aspartate kinase [Thermoplasmata archaeon]
MTRVLKFGGAALRDAAGIRRAAAIVASGQGPRIVVTSAMEGVTDQLLAAQGGARASDTAVKPAIDALRERHAATLRGLAPNDAAAAAALASTLEKLERLLHGIAYTQEVTPRLHDLVQSHGERLAAPLVAAALRQAGVAAVALDGETARIRSRGPFGNALPDLDGLRREAAPALQRLTDAGQVPVVTGYYGVDADGQATLFGRGGSDYVAALVAYAVKAECLELWKDVAGFMTADPRAVPGARLLPRIGYDEAAELANFGAKVLHPRTVEPVQDAGIPIHIRPVADPTGPGTAVVADPGAADALVRSVATTTGLAVLRLNGPGMAYTPGVARRVFTPLAEAGVNVINMATSQASFALLLDEADLARAQQALDGLRGGTVQSFQSMAGRSLVCVVGRGLGEVPGSAARILQAVAAAGVNVEMISLGASDIAIDFVVRQESAARAVRAIHDTFLAG